MANFGVSFQPGANAPEEMGSGATAVRRRNPVQEAIQILSMRLPKTFGARSLAPAPLLMAPGGMGQPAARGNVSAEAIRTLAGLPAAPFSPLNLGPGGRKVVPPPPGGVTPPGSQLTLDDAPWTGPWDRVINDTNTLPLRGPWDRVINDTNTLPLRGMKPPGLIGPPVGGAAGGGSGGGGVRSDDRLGLLGGGRMFTGGNPYFNEATGQPYTDAELAARYPAEWAAYQQRIGGGPTPFSPLNLGESGRKVVPPPPSPTPGGGNLGLTYDAGGAVQEQQPPPPWIAPAPGRETPSPPAWTAPPAPVFQPPPQLGQFPTPRFTPGVQPSPAWTAPAAPAAPPIDLDRIQAMVDAALRQVRIPTGASWGGSF